MKLPRYLAVDVHLFHSDMMDVIYSVGSLIAAGKDIPPLSALYAADRLRACLHSIPEEKARLEMLIEVLTQVGKRDYAALARRWIATTYLKEEVMEALAERRCLDLCSGRGSNWLDSVTDLLQELDINIEQQLSYDLADTVIERINQYWQGKYSVAELYRQWGPSALGNLALQQIGQGTSPIDDRDVSDHFDSLGIQVPFGGYELSNLEIRDLVIQKIQAKGWAR